MSRVSKVMFACAIAGSMLAGSMGVAVATAAPSAATRPVHRPGAGKYSSKHMKTHGMTHRKVLTVNPSDSNHTTYGAAPLNARRQAHQTGKGVVGTQ